MDKEALEVLAARYLWELRRNADKTASEADYQNDGPLVAAKRIRGQADIAEGVLSEFIAWASNGRRRIPS